MAQLKKCPYCAEDILVEAKKCKHCGEFLDNSLKPEIKGATTKVIAKEGCFLQTLNTGCIIIFIILGGIFLGLYLASY